MEIYIANYNDLNLEIEYEKYFEFFTLDEKNKITRYVKLEDKARCVLGLILIKSLAIKNIGDKNIIISKNVWGKPYINSNKSFNFNISHSNNLVAIIISNEEVGIDIEYVREINLKCFSKVLTEYEMRMIKKSNNQIDKFYEIWTVKECFSKEEGIGLSILDHNFAIDYKHNSIKYNNKHIEFKTFHIDKYIISICSKNISNDIKVNFLNKQNLKKLVKVLEE